MVEVTCLSRLGHLFREVGSASASYTKVASQFNLLHRGNLEKVSVQDFHHRNGSESQRVCAKSASLRVAVLKSISMDRGCSGHRSSSGW